MGQADFYKKGAFNALCDGCGFKFKSTELRLRWDGFMMCQWDWNPRQPQDFVRGIPDPQAIPWSRPAGSLQFVENNGPDAEPVT